MVARKKIGRKIRFVGAVLRENQMFESLPTALTLSFVAMLLTENAHSAPPATIRATTPSHHPPGITILPTVGNKIAYVGPTPDLTAVANAIQVQASSLTSVVTVGSGLSLARPVTISIAYLSAWPTGSDRVEQTYAPKFGNRFVRVDLEGDGKPRKLHLDITLSEPNPGGGVYSFNVPTEVVLAPLYDVTITPLRFTLLETCNLVGKTSVNFFWYTPDKQPEYRKFKAKGGQTVVIADFAWQRNQVAASANLNPPTHMFRTDNLIDLNELSGGFAPGLSPSDENLVPGKTRAINTGLENARNEDTCRAAIEYTMTYQLRAYGVPTARSWMRKYR
jgi:hypothetical protein